MNAVVVTNSNWAPLSSIYKCDDNIGLYGNPMITTDGYRGHVQNVYNNPKDNAINKNTIVHLPDSMGILDCIYDKGKPEVLSGGQTKIYLYIGAIKYYIAVDDNEEYIYLSSDENKAALFRIDVHEDNSLSFYYGVNKLITVADKEPLLLSLDTPYNFQQQYRQQFNYEVYANNQIAIITKGITRYWAYRTTGPYAYRIRANGYITEAGIQNEYLFTVPNFEDIIKYDMKGLTVDHHWVTYHDLVDDKTNNRNVVLDKKIQVDVQHLVDNPYHKTDLNNKTTEINIANLKNVMTGEYNYEKL